MVDKMPADPMKDMHPNEGGFKEFLWNPDTKEFLGRNALSWAKITIFYIFFYIGLAAFFGFCLYIFHLTLNETSPKWILSQSLIGTNPGMGFRPMPDQDVNPQSTLIWYKQKDTGDYKFWSNQLEHLVNLVDSASQQSENLLSCNYTNSVAANETHACKLDLSQVEQCSKTNDFGYPSAEPCIIIKLNKVYGWQPDGFGLKDGQYDQATLQRDLKDQTDNFGMPASLVEYITEQVAPNGTAFSYASSFLNTVWITCDGENVADKENIGIQNNRTKVDYLPQHGIPGFYYPYYNQPHYQTPFIFVRLLKPYHGVLINVECKAWARNVHPDRLTRSGSVHFELLID